MKALLLTLALMGCSVSAFAQGNDPNFYFRQDHPNSVLGLGVGFSLGDLTASRARCLEYDQDDVKKDSDSDAVLDEQIELRVLTSESDLQTGLGLNSKNGASSFAVGGNTSSLSVEFRAMWVNGRYSIRKHSWTPAAKALLNKPEAFERTCGSRFVLSETRGGMVSMVLVLSRLSDEERIQLVESIEAKATVGPALFSQQTQLDAALTRFAEEDRLDFRVKSMGGASFDAPPLRDPSGKGVTLAMIENAFKQYQRKVVNPVPISYHVTRMDVLGVSPDVGHWSERKRLQLKALEERRAQLSGVLASAHAIVGRKDVRAKGLSAEGLQAIRAAIPRLEEAVALYADTKKACEDSYGASKPCQLPAVEEALLTVVPPMPPEPAVEIRVQTQEGLLSPADFRHLKRRVPFDNFLGLVRGRHHSAEWVEVWLVLHGERLQNAQLRLGGVEIGSTTFDNPIPEREFRVLLYKASRSSEESPLKNRLDDILGDPLFSWKQGEGFDPPITVSVHDAYGRTFDLPLGSLKTSVEPGISGVSLYVALSPLAAPMAFMRLSAESMEFPE